VPGKKEKKPLSVTHPELAKQADGWDPSEVTYGSQLKKSWKCSQGHIWVISPNGRTAKGGANCPFCSNQRLLVGFNDLETTHPELAVQASGWSPTSVSAGTKKKLEWKCKFGHYWNATVSSRSSMGLGCPVCSNKKILKGFNDLATTNPNLASQAYGWDPSTVSERSGKRREWMCSQNHTWSAVIGARSSMNEGCPYCSNQKILAGFNDLKTTHPEIASEAFGWDTSKFNAGSIKRMDWECSLGHTYKSVIRDRAKRGTNCPICAGRIVKIGFNDLRTLNPHLAQEAFDWNPETVTNASNKIVSWKCNEGHIWDAKVANRSLLGRGCPTCAKTGFDPSKLGYIYFLSHPRWEMYQIGISNFPDSRIGSHKHLGWKLVEVRGPMDGHLTQQWETAILRMLRAKGADLSNSKIAGKFDGYSEAWSKSTFEVKSIKELMKLTEEFEERKIGN
jgi:hypothetical protein